LEVRGTLDSAQLANAQHWTHDGVFQADGIGNEHPDVRVGLENQRNALDGGGIGVFAPLDKTLFDELLRVSEQGNPLTGGALAAKVVLQAFAIRSLREHARQREFADAARTSEQQGVRNAGCAERSAQGGHDAFIA